MIPDYANLVDDDLKLKELACCMIVLAIDDLRGTRGSEKAQSWKSSAYRWIVDPNPSKDPWIMTFTGCCFLLGLDAGAARKQILTSPIKKKLMGHYVGLRPRGGSRVYKRTWYKIKAAKAYQCEYCYGTIQAGDICYFRHSNNTPHAHLHCCESDNRPKNIRKEMSSSAKQSHVKRDGYNSRGPGNSGNDHRQLRDVHRHV